MLTHSFAEHYKHWRIIPEEAGGGLSPFPLFDKLKNIFDHINNNRPPLILVWICHWLQAKILKSDKTVIYNQKKISNHDEAVSDPESGPAARTIRDVRGLAVESDGVGGHVADRTATDEVRYFAAFDGHHRQRSGRRQPVRLVVATGVVTDVHEVAEHERHRAEPLQARPGPPYHKLVSK